MDNACLCCFEYAEILKTEVSEETVKKDLNGKNQQVVPLPVDAVWYDQASHFPAFYVKRNQMVSLSRMSEKP
ncbi:hypothetical protein TNIN_14551, partial [Trichonephila inaurata madagascariensis]